MRFNFAMTHHIRTILLQCRQHAKHVFASCRAYSNTEDYVIHSPYPDATLPKIPLHQYLFSDSSKWANRIALECSVTKRSYTYSEARQFSKSVASVLQNNFGLKKGDCIALVSPNTPEYPLFITASSEIGIVLTTVNSNYTSDEISKQILDSKAKVVVTIPAMFNVVKEALGKIKLDLPILVVKNNDDSNIPRGGIPLNDLLTNTCELKAVDVDLNDDLVMPYSSGTTGLPKGVQLTHGNITANLAQCRYPDIRLINPTTETTQDSVLGLLPMYHIYGMVAVSLGTLLEGGKLVVFPKFDPKQMLEAMVEYQIKLLYLVPPLVLFLADHPSVTPDHLKYVKTINSGAAPLSKSDSLRFSKKAPHVRQHQGYGLTETSPVVMISSGKDHMENCGPPVPNTSLKVVDLETGFSLPPGKAGELLIKGPQVMKGYLNQPKATEESFVNGWLKSGDIAIYDEKGEFRILERQKELIKVKGLQVAPAEIEAILREHSEIVEAAVIGISHERYGEVPKAFVVKTSNSNIKEQEIIDYISDKVAEHKRLTGGVVFINEIPKSAAGKILRKLLKTSTR